MTESFEDVKESAYQWANGTPTCGCHEAKSMGVVACYEMCKWLDRLKAAHDAEMKQLSKTEFHRGYESGLAARDASQWQLDRERAEVVRGLLAIEFDGGSHWNLSRIAHAIYSPQSSGWTAGACEQVRDELVRLLGGDGNARNTTDFAGNQQNGPKSGNKAPEMQKSEPESRDSLQEVEPSSIADERHKAVCRLRGFEPCIGGKPTDEASKLIRCIIGREDCHVACCNDLEEARDRLIHLLGGDRPTLSDLYGILRDSTDVANQDAEPDAQFAKNGKNREMGQDDGTSNGTCPNDVPIASITGELRKWMGVVLTSDDYAWAIADRIDEQFARCCEMWERTATDTAQEVHDSMEAECNKLQAKYDRLRKRYRKLKHRVLHGMDTSEYQRGYDDGFASADKSIMRDYILGAALQAVRRIEALRDA